jgi:hypothetical protein
MRQEEQEEDTVSLRLAHKGGFCVHYGRVSILIRDAVLAQEAALSPSHPPALQPLPWMTSVDRKALHVPGKGAMEPLAS